MASVDVAAKRREAQLKDARRRQGIFYKWSSIFKKRLDEDKALLFQFKAEAQLRQDEDALFSTILDSKHRKAADDDLMAFLSSCLRTQQDRFKKLQTNSRSGQSENADSTKNKGQALKKVGSSSKVSEDGFLEAVETAELNQATLMSQCLQRRQAAINGMNAEMMQMRNEMETILKKQATLKEADERMAQTFANTLDLSEGKRKSPRQPKQAESPLSRQQKQTKSPASRQQKQTESPSSREQKQAESPALLFFTGGFDTVRKMTLDTMRIFDVQKNQWSFGTSLPERRHSHSLVIFGPDICLIGGRDDKGKLSKQSMAHTSECEQWAPFVKNPVCFEDSAATVCQDILYVSGGRQTLSTLRSFDPITNEWMSLKSMNYDRSNHSLVDVRGSLFAVSDRNSTTRLEKYDIARNSWSLKPLEVSNAAKATCFDSELYILNLETKTLQMYEPNTDQMIEQAYLPNGVSPSSMIMASKKSLLLFNTFDDDRIFVFEPKKRTWRTLKAKMPFQHVIGCGITAL